MLTLSASRHHGFFAFTTIVFGFGFAAECRPSGSKSRAIASANVGTTRRSLKRLGFLRQIIAAPNRPRNPELADAVSAVVFERLVPKHE